MIDHIANFTSDLWTQARRARRSASGWISGNAVCCAHRGETADTRSRGGLIANPNGAVTYRCFNCNFKASYAPGRPLTYKFRKLLAWMGADPNAIERLGIEALRIKDLVPTTELAPVESEPITFNQQELPAGAVNFHGMAEFYQLSNQAIPADFIEVVDYVANRKIDLQKYQFYWADDKIYGLNKRVIIPFLWKGQTVGYTARSVDAETKPKYHSSHDSNYVFNVDQQQKNWKFVVVCEGPFDAMSIDGVAVLHNDINEQQADVIDSLGCEVVVVPDFDIKYDERTKKKKWAGAALIDRAIEYGWSVSFPVWAETCKDVNEAVQKYGKLFVLKAIIQGKQTSKLKIELLKRRLYN